MHKYKKNFSFLALGTIVSITQEPMAVKSARDGSIENPFKIDSLPNLDWLSMQDDDNEP